MLRRLLALLAIVLALLPALACTTADTLPPPEVACRQDAGCHPAP